jgi:hypothetical protein
MGTVTTKIKEEVLKMLPPTLFFFVILHIVAFIQALMNRHTSIALPTSASITLAALVLGKSVLIAEMLPFINRFPEKPLIWNVSWKTTIYCFVALVIHYLEHLYDFWKEAPGVRGRQRKVALRDRVAAFLGNPDPACLADRHVLCDSGARACHRRRPDEDDVHRSPAGQSCLGVADPRDTRCTRLSRLMAVLTARLRRDRG